MHEGPAKEFFAKMDAANVDLKAFTDDFYFKPAAAACSRCSTLWPTSRTKAVLAGDHHPADPRPQRL